MDRSPWALDLDGVIWRGDEPVPGSAAAVADIRAAGATVVFVTNSSAHTIAEVEAKLARHGIDGTGAVRTSAQAAATLVAPGERVLVCGGDGLTEAVTAVGAVAVVNDGTDPGPVDTVLCGYWRAVDHDRLRWASTAVLRGARLLASNDDATYPAADGLVPGGGATLAAVERATGVTATVAGKPHRPMADRIRSELGPTGTVVGDRLDTDGLLARVLGWRFGLVLSGVTRSAEGAEPRPDAVAADLSALVAASRA
ncbi:HAD-IIA family hydrolase [Iamia sp. SCSIO 61187]|uniref:HAD-IIA family hydrolase n=1 Tax=Iamia sp. SCSIO 61187 TaxID=2722752 RepID=UPI001C62921F|nr:HAD-IIA family hydrolase [Iamia sp. SCSIO 61187]QYG92826.1 HAD-IIA family hydrolase [Iamia sp. SCSIO 61187]